jgi:glycosyltransferase involved in cell wall biosynthesis
MIHLFINALGASAGGGLTYIRNLVPRLEARDDIRATILLTSHFRTEFTASSSVDFVEQTALASATRRFWTEQRSVADLVRKSRADVLLSAGNFALWRSPVPQILLSRNALYTSRDFLRDLTQRGDYQLWLDTQVKAAVAKWSIREATVTVAPSEAFAQELRQWTGADVVAIHHGFDRDVFESNQCALPLEISQKLASIAGALRILFVSHYNYYRNFETLLRTIPLLRDRLPSTKIRVLLTCELKTSANPGSYQADSAARLVRDLNIGENVVELGSVPYHLLHHVYKASDIYVTSAYAESFAHPLVEAMSIGLPVVASDIGVHREICGEAALYFSRFSAQDLADQVERIVNREDVAERLSAVGRVRSQDFSWRNHAEQIVRLARQVLTSYP